MRGAPLPCGMKSSAWALVSGQHNHPCIHVDLQVEMSQLIGPLEPSNAQCWSATNRFVFSNLGRWFAAAAYRRPWALRHTFNTPGPPLELTNDPPITSGFENSCKHLTFI